MDALKHSKHRNNYMSVLVLTNNAVFPQKLPRKLVRNKSNFHRAMKNVITLAQIFGLMPVYGARNSSIDALHFKWMSAKTIHSFVGIFSIIIMGFLFLLEFYRDDMNFGHLVGTIYYLIQTVGYCLFIKLAMKWLMLNKEWLKMEIAMAQYAYQPNDYRRFKITSIVIMVLALVEHLLGVMKSIYVSQSCAMAKTEPLRAYFGLCCANVFSFTSYALWKAFLNEIPIVMATFHWNFIDLFIILCSAAMAERFKQINKHIAGTQVQNQEFWTKTREDYTRLWNLCRTLDSVIKNMVTLSFISNLFFICWQMYNSLKPMIDIYHFLYFLFSFGFLLGRTGAVSIYCCWINDESKEILMTLFNTPEEFFCLDADRLINQICSAPAALTGSNFFAVTRGLCLQVASAIITFEIILVQMAPSFLKTDEVKPPDCVP